MVNVTRDTLMNEIVPVNLRHLEVRIIYSRIRQLYVEAEVTLGVIYWFNYKV